MEGFEQANETDQNYGTNFLSVLIFLLIQQILSHGLFHPSCTLMESCPLFMVLSAIQLCNKAHGIFYHPGHCFADLVGSSIRKVKWSPMPSSYQALINLDCQLEFNSLCHLTDLLTQNKIHWSINGNIIDNINGKVHLNRFITQMEQPF